MIPPELFMQQKGYLDLIGVHQNYLRMRNMCTQIKYIEQITFSAPTYHSSLKLF
jgi:hypothetical protein